MATNRAMPPEKPNRHGKSIRNRLQSYAANHSPAAAVGMGPARESTEGAPRFQHANRPRRTDEAYPFAETPLRCPPSFDGANREQCRSENFAPPVNHPVRDKSQFASRRAISGPLARLDFQHVFEPKVHLPDSEQKEFAAHLAARDRSACRTRPDCAEAQSVRPSRRVSVHRRIRGCRASERAMSRW